MQFIFLLKNFFQKMYNHQFQNTPFFTGYNLLCFSMFPSELWKKFRENQFLLEAQWNHAQEFQNVLPTLIPLVMRFVLKSG